MSMTGVKLDCEVVPFINSMNIGKGHKFAIFEFSEDQKFIKHCYSEEQNPKQRTKTKEEDNEAFERLKKYLTDHEKKASPSYIIYDFSFTSETLGGRTVEQLVMLS